MGGWLFLFLPCLQAVAVHLLSALLAADKSSTALAEVCHREKLPKALLDSVVANAEAVVMQHSSKAQVSLGVCNASVPTMRVWCIPRLASFTFMRYHLQTIALRKDGGTNSFAIFRKTPLTVMLGLFLQGALQVLEGQLGLLLDLTAAGGPYAQKASTKAVADAGVLPALARCK